MDKIILAIMQELVCNYSDSDFQRLKESLKGYVSERNKIQNIIEKIMKLSESVRGN